MCVCFCFVVTHGFDGAKEIHTHVVIRWSAFTTSWGLCACVFVSNLFVVFDATAAIRGPAFVVPELAYVCVFSFVVTHGFNRAKEIHALTF